MINISNERVVTLAEAASLLPRRRQGRKVHVSCLYRWSQRGVRGVILETVQVGGSRCTSVEALQRFVDRLSQASQGGAAQRHAPAVRAPDRWVTRQLEREGL